MNSKLKAIEARALLTQRIDFVISSVFTYKSDPKAKLGRNYVQRYILKRAGEPRVSAMCRLVNQRMKKFGFNAVTTRGYNYYNHIELMK